MWPCFNIWGLTRIPARTPPRTPAWPVMSIVRAALRKRLHVEADWMRAGVVVKALSLLTLSTPYWPVVKPHYTSFQLICLKSA